MTTITTVNPSARTSLGHTLLAGLAGGALAATANTALFLIGKAAGVAFLAPVNGPAAPLVALQPFNVIMLSLLPALVAALLLAGLARFTQRPQAIFLVIAAIVLLVSLVPDWALPLDSLATRILLSLMHLVAAMLIVGALLRSRRG